MILSQLIVGNLKNLTYVLGDEHSHQGVIIDPSWDLDRVVWAARKQGLEIIYILNTHSHWDHTAGNREVAQRTGGKIIAHRLSPTKKDLVLDGDEVLEVGDLRIKVMYTPGHCADSLCFLLNELLFTGDTLFVGDCGRTDLPGGNPEALYESFGKILMLSDSTHIYPGHDYGSRPSTSLRYEKRHNHALQAKSKDEFVKMMMSAIPTT